MYNNIITFRAELFACERVNVLIFIYFGVLFTIVLTIIITGMIRYKRALKSADWYEDLTYVLQSEDCPHEQTIRVADTDWRINFKLTKEVPDYKEFGSRRHVRQKTTRLFYCELCQKQRWFRLVNGKELQTTINSLRTKYALSIMGLVFVTFVVTTLGFARFL